jgi:hypothetical protein
MFTKSVRHFGYVAFLLGFASQASADALTYDFSGTLSQPYNGSTQFTGTLTYDTDLPLNPATAPYPGLAGYTGVPLDPTEPVLSLTFNLGNTPSSSFGTVQSDELLIDHASSNDSFTIYETLGGSGKQTVSVELELWNNNLVTRGPFSSSNPPPSLNLADFGGGAGFSVWGYTGDAETTNIYGTVNSLTSPSWQPPGTQTPVPEPASALVFLVVGVAFVGYRRATPRTPKVPSA